MFGRIGIGEQTSTVDMGSAGIDSRFWHAEHVICLSNCPLTKVWNYQRIAFDVLEVSSNAMISRSAISYLWSVSLQNDPDRYIKGLTCVLILRFIFSPSFSTVETSTIISKLTIYYLHQVKITAEQNKQKAHYVYVRYWSNGGDTVCVITMSWWTRWRLRSQALRLFTQLIISAQINENIKAPCH